MGPERVPGESGPKVFHEGPLLLGRPGQERGSGVGTGSAEVIDLAQTFEIATPPETRSSRLSC